MRVLIDATPLQTGHRNRGVGTYTRELLRALLRLDQETEYGLIVHPGSRQPKADARRREGITPESVLGLADQPQPSRVRFIGLPWPELGRWTGFVTHQALLPAVLARERADLFHAPGLVAAFSVPGLPWRVAMPLVVTLHDFLPRHVPELYNDKRINRWWYGWQLQRARRAQRLICVSQATRQDALAFLAVAPERCVTIHEGVDREVFHPAPARPAESPSILFVGGDFPNKNRGTALAAFERLAQETSLPHRLVMVGQELRSAAELGRLYPALDLSRVQRLPQVSRVELAQLYRDADAFLFPSTYEGFGLPVLEAMASGTPVIASRASSIPEVAGDAALLVDPYDVPQWTHALKQVLQDERLHDRLAARGLRRAEGFTWEATARQTLAVYREVAQARP